MRPVASVHDLSSHVQSTPFATEPSVNSHGAAPTRITANTTNKNLVHNTTWDNPNVAGIWLRLMRLVPCGCLDKRPGIKVNKVKKKVEVSKIENDEGNSVGG